MSIEREKGEWPTCKLPTGWVWAAFRDVFEDKTSADKKVKQGDYLGSGAFPVVDQGQEVVGGYTNDRRLAYDGSLPAIVFGDHTKCVKFIEQQFAQGADGVRVLVPTRALTPRFAFLGLKVLRLPDKGYSRHFKFLKASEFPLPPVAEQKRIVAKAEELFERVWRAKDALDVVPRLLNELRQSVLAAAFRGDLTAGWRAKNLAVKPVDKLLEWKAARGPVRRGVPEHVEVSGEPERWPLPATWSRRSVAELLRCGILEDVKDGNHGVNHPKLADFTESGLPFITAAQVSEFKIDYDGAPKVDGTPLARLRVGFAKPGDVIFTHKGTVGRTGVCERDCVLTPQTTYYRCRQDLLDPWFVAYFMASPQFSAQYTPVMSQTTRDFIPISRQYEMFFAVPPISEQKVLVARLSRALRCLQAQTAFVETTLLHLLTLEKAILAKAFRGELVPQDPNDEPAFVLLERLRAEAVEEPSRKVGRGRNAEPKQVPPAETTPSSATECEESPNVAPLALARASAPVPEVRHIPTEQAALAFPVDATPFLDLPTDAQAELVHAVLLGEGPLPREDAVRRAAELLRDQGRAQFQRLRGDGPLATAIDHAISLAIRQDRLDRPQRGSVRALARTPADIPPALWGRAILAARQTTLDADPDTLIRTAATWLQTQVGLEFQRLRTGGHIDTALRQALAAEPARV